MLIGFVLCTQKYRSHFLLQAKLSVASWRNIAWLLKNSFQGISPAKFVRKLLNVRSPQARKFAEITGSGPFSTATPDYNSYRKS
jgi:hypothetical protein